MICSKINCEYVFIAKVLSTFRLQPATEATIIVFVDEWQNIKCKERPCQTISDLLVEISNWASGGFNGFQGIYKIIRRLLKYQLGSAREIRKWFGNYHTTNS